MRLGLGGALICCFVSDLNAPVRRWQQRAGTCHDVSRLSTRYGRLQESRAIANHSPPQLGDRSPNVESASKHPSGSDFRSGWYPHFILVPRRVAIGTLFFAATPPSFTMLRIIRYAPSSQGCSRRHFRPEPFHPTTAFSHLEFSGPIRRNGHNDAQSNRQRGKPG